MKTAWHWTNLLPTERAWVTIGVFALAGALLLMARENPDLWGVKLFEVILQAVVFTGLMNMILAFHFAANKSDEAKTENTHAAFRAIEATANKAGDGNALQDGDSVTMMRESDHMKGD